MSSVRKMLFVSIVAGVSATGYYGFEFHRERAKQTETEIAQAQRDLSDLRITFHDISNNLDESTRHVQKLMQELTGRDIQISYLNERIHELTPQPVINPAPMTSTMKLVTEAGGHGSGTHIGGGYVVTAAHVAKEEGSIMTATFENGDELEAVTQWINSQYDIALLKIDGTDVPVSHLECRTPETGEKLRFLGNPLAMEWITTTGYVAGPVTASYKTWAAALPVDAAIADGMSGGGAFDENGNLVGVNVGIPLQMLGLTSTPTATGISFVVPGEVVCGLLARTE